MAPWMTAEEIRQLPPNVITRALGIREDVLVDLATETTELGDVYLLCSDGLTGMISEEQVAEILAASGSLDDVAQKLIAAANENGGRDNITVVLFRLEGDSGDADDPDTLGDQATQAGVNAETVRAAVADAEASQRPDEARETEPGGRPAVTRAHEQADEEQTIVERPSQAQEGREHTRIGTATVEGGVPSSSPTHARRAPPISRRRRILAVLGVLLVLVAAVAVVWIVNRQFWFVGTNDSGQVTLFRGLPYELPLGIEMYDAEQTTDVPAAAITDPRQRKYVLDHHARGKDDSVDLVKQIERNFSRP
jgi:PPM family protein phosphatase